MITPTHRNSALQRGWLSYLWFEPYLSWRFIRSNFPPSVLAGVVFAVGAWHATHASLWRLPGALAMSCVFTWLFIYVHELANQDIGSAEDAVNKPSRPIPSGMCTPQASRRRLIPVGLTFLLLAGLIGALGWALLWLASVWCTHYTRAHRWWAFKSLHAAIGAPVIAAGNWAAGGAHLTQLGWAWIAASFLYWSGVFLLQDQRDIAGDELIGRRTFPIVAGERAARIGGAVFLAILPADLVAPVWLQAGQSLTTGAVEILFTAASWHLGWRFTHRRSRRADDLTYKLYAALFCVLAAGPLLA